MDPIRNFGLRSAANPIPPTPQIPSDPHVAATTTLTASALLPTPTPIGTGVLTSLTAADAANKVGLTGASRDDLCLPIIVAPYDRGHFTEEEVHDSVGAWMDHELNHRGNKFQIAFNGIGDAIKPSDSSRSASDRFKFVWAGLARWVKVERRLKIPPEQTTYQPILKTLLVTPIETIHYKNGTEATLSEIFHDRVENFWDFMAEEYNDLLNRLPSATDQSEEANQDRLQVIMLLVQLASSPSFPAESLGLILDRVIQLGARFGDIMPGNGPKNLATMSLILICRARRDMPESIKQAAQDAYTKAGIEPQIDLFDPRV